jgi:4-diphosphocytidyl-2-C-methyl-D-erythritol kinase
MIVFPNAKINLGLKILGKRSDGFHALETLMVPIPLYDVLEVTDHPTFEYCSSGIPIPTHQGLTLCEKAYYLLSEYHPLGPVRIHLRKQIPIGAGLGGGSSDAAFTLMALNQWFELGCSKAELETYAATLGSDCPFFIRNEPVLASGRGEVLEGITLDVNGVFLALYNPEIHMSTSDAYASLDSSTFGKRLPMDRLADKKYWQEDWVNDFELPAVTKHLAIKEGIKALKEAGAFYAALSGSGSSYFGLFLDPEALVNLPNKHLIYKGVINMTG